LFETTVSYRFIHKTVYNGIRHYEVINNEVINNEVINNEVINNEVINNEVINNEEINNEVINNEVINYEVINYEIINNEVLMKFKTYAFQGKFSSFTFHTSISYTNTPLTWKVDNICQKYMS
jgi:hypothetical protein